MASQSQHTQGPEGNKLPEDESNRPPPPPYTPVANPMFEQTAEVNMNAPYVAQGQGNSSAASSRPAASQQRPPPPQQQHHYQQNYQQQPQPNFQQSYPQNFQQSSSSSSSTLHGGNSSYPGTSSSHTYGGKPSSSAPPPPQRYQAPPPRQQNRIPWVYPPNYHCYKCNNTGVKLKNGKSCKDCYQLFAHQNAAVVYQSTPSFFVPPLFRPTIPGFGSSYGPTTVVRGANPSAVVVGPGDARIGGVMCGRCRGRGMISDIFGSMNCPTCRGIGRLV